MPIMNLKVGQEPCLNETSIDTETYYHEKDNAKACNFIDDRY